MKFIFWSGIALFVGSLILVLAKYDDVKVEKNGTLVKMIVQKAPGSCFSSKVKHFVTLKYQAKTYLKMIKGIPCESFYVGQFIEMRYLQGNSTILFPHESVIKELVSGGILSIFGLVISLSQLKKMKR